MSKIGLVAKREFLTNLRRPAFLITAFGAPLFSVGFMLLVFSLMFNASGDGGLGAVGYVDLSGVLAAAVEQPEGFVRLDDEAAAQAALADGAVGAYFVVDADYMNSGAVRLYSPSRVPEAVTDALDAFLLANVRDQHGGQDIFERISSPVDMMVRVQDSGRTLSEGAVGGLILVPTVFALVFFFSIQTSGSYLMSGVVEEKTTRIIEVLVTSITPLQLLVGKVIGLGLLGLLQMAVWLAAGAISVNFGSGIEFLQGVTIPLDLVAVTLLYFFLSYFMYAGLLAAVGAVSNSEQESRQFSSIVTLIAIVPFFFVTAFIFNPDSPLVVALTLIPFTAPLSAILRMSLSSIPAWQFAASVLILLVTTALVLWGGARIFRWSLLMYGKRLSLRELWRVARGAAGARMGTAAAKEQNA